MDLFRPHRHAADMDGHDHAVRALIHREMQIADPVDIGGNLFSHLHDIHLMAGKSTVAWLSHHPLTFDDERQVPFRFRKRSRVPDMSTFDGDVRADRLAVTDTDIDERFPGGRLEESRSLSTSRTRINDPHRS